jgi:hypothetical protein
MKLLSCNIATQLIALACVALIAPGDSILLAQSQSAQSQPPTTNEPPPLKPAELESLVAPIALYPDQLVAQTLAAATYPLEIVEAARWLAKNSSLKGDSLVKAAAQQNWEPSVQALVVFPDLLQQLSQNLTWTTALGNAFLAQQEDTMSAVQRLRAKAQANGALQSNPQQTVSDQQVDGANVIVIQPANPDVVYVPTYDPVAVYGPAQYYPYPSLVYPSTGAIVASGLIGFGTGVAIGAIFGGGGWGWGCHWGPRPSLYVNNTFINRSGFHGSGYVGRTGNAAWTHNPADRGSVPYSRSSVANRYGSAARVATPNGTAGAVSGSRGGGAVGVKTPNGAAGAVTGPRGNAAGGITTPNGSAAGVRGPNGSSGSVTTPGGGASRIAPPTMTAPTMPRGNFNNQRPSPFGGGGGQPQMNSPRGGASRGMGGMGGGMGGRGGGRPAGGGRRR